MVRPTVLVVGASRGIGLEFVGQYLANGAHVMATARKDEDLKVLQGLGAVAIKLDVADAVSASGLAWQLDGAVIDVAIVNAGVYGPRTEAMTVPTESDFDSVMHTNLLGPMRVIPQLVDSLAPAARLAVLSSEMGSISERSSASGWLYRASKAALNSVLKDVSLVLGHRATCIALHPGWVRTDMGGSMATLTAQQSVEGMRSVIEQVGPRETGGFFDYGGRKIRW